MIMMNEQRSRSRRTRKNNAIANQNGNREEDDESAASARNMIMRDIHALTPQPTIANIPSPPSSSAGENFTTISREFNALVLAGARIRTDQNQSAIVLDPNPPHSPTTVVQRVKKEEVETKITAWQNAKIAKLNNRFKREEAIINTWEDEQHHKASSSMKRVQRKIEEKRAKAMEKMQNEIAKAQRKAEERKANAESKRGTQIARVLEIANIMKAMGRRPPSKRSFF